MDTTADSEDVKDDKVLVCGCCYAVYSSQQEIDDHQCSISSKEPSSEPGANDGSDNTIEGIAGDILDKGTSTEIGVYNDVDDPAEGIDGYSSEDPTDNGTDEGIFGSSMFHCVPCGHVFNEEAMFHNHKCRKRKPPRTYTCGMCGKSYQKACVLQAHLKIHYASKEFTCSICSKAFLHKHQLRVHEVTHSSSRPYECDICDARFKRITHLSRHKMVHTGKKSYSCDRCDYKSVSTYAIRRHKMNVHTAERPFACNLCSAFFSENYKLRAHMQKMHNPNKPSKLSKKFQRSMVQCLFCDKKFYWRKHLSTHLQSDHVEDFQKLNVKMEDSQVNSCSSSNPTDPDFVPDSGPTNQMENIIQDGLAKSKCWFCEKTFSRETGLIRHMKVHHSSDYKKACNNIKSENDI